MNTSVLFSVCCAMHIFMQKVSYYKPIGSTRIYNTEKRARKSNTIYLNESQKSTST